MSRSECKGSPWQARWLQALAGVRHGDGGWWRGAASTCLRVRLVRRSDSVVASGVGPPHHATTQGAITALPPNTTGPLCSAALSATATLALPPSRSPALPLSPQHRYGAPPRTTRSHAAATRRRADAGAAHCGASGHDTLPCHPPTAPAPAPANASMDQRRRPEYSLDIFADPACVKDVVKGQLSLLLHRLVSPSALLRPAPPDASATHG